jgi:peptidoglycan/xylan/chitin deacetylase (PgdA/CDA1 family)
MEIVPHKTPSWLKQMYPKRIWDYINTGEQEKTIYLTFDDGPIPKVTPWVLKTLDLFEAKASFFCIGNNLKKHPELASLIVKKGHSLGNHTQNHVNGWKTNFGEYVDDFQLAEAEFKKHKLKTNLFRPPYGRITSKQAEYILKQKQLLVMWDVLTKDYAQHLNPEPLLQKSIAATESGSIVVFHDSEKAFKNLSYILPEYLAHFRKLGYQFKAI